MDGFNYDSHRCVGNSGINGPPSSSAYRILFSKEQENFSRDIYITVDKDILRVLTFFVEAQDSCIMSSGTVA